MTTQLAANRYLPGFQIFTATVRSRILEVSPKCYYYKRLLISFRLPAAQERLDSITFSGTSAPRPQNKLRGTVAYHVLAGIVGAMLRLKLEGMHERSAIANLWSALYPGFRPVHGRLTDLASRRDANSGIYRHYALSTGSGREESNKALQESHERAFAEWLKLPLADQHADLKAHLGSLEEPRSVVLDHWVQSRVYRGHVPVSALAMERELFFRDLEALLVVLKAGCADEGRARNSSPPASPGR